MAPGYPIVASFSSNDLSRSPKQSHRPPTHTHAVLLSIHCTFATPHLGAHVAAPLTPLPAQARDRQRPFTGPQPVPALVLPSSPAHVRRRLVDPQSELRRLPPSPRRLGLLHSRRCGREDGARVLYQGAQGCSGGRGRCGGVHRECGLGSGHHGGVGRCGGANGGGAVISE
jgi:hypothetical protein